MKNPQRSNQHHNDRGQHIEDTASGVFDGFAAGSRALNHNLGRLEGEDEQQKEGERWPLFGQSVLVPEDAEVFEVPACEPAQKPLAHLRPSLPAPEHSQQQYLNASEADADNQRLGQLGLPRRYCNFALRQSYYYFSIRPIAHSGLHSSLSALTTAYDSHAIVAVDFAEVAGLKGVQIEL